MSASPETACVRLFNAIAALGKLAGPAADVKLARTYGGKFNASIGSESVWGDTPETALGLLADRLADVERAKISESQALNEDRRLVLKAVAEAQASVVGEPQAIAAAGGAR